jgi:hypothetical protein
MDPPTYSSSTSVSWMSHGIYSSSSHPMVMRSLRNWSKCLGSSGIAGHTFFFRVLIPNNHSLFLGISTSFGRTTLPTRVLCLSLRLPRSSLSNRALSTLTLFGNTKPWHRGGLGELRWNEQWVVQFKAAHFKARIAAGSARDLSISIWLPIRLLILPESAANPNS